MPSAHARRHVESLDEPVTKPVHEHQVYLLIGEAEARQLMAGKVPTSVAEQARAAIEWEFELLKLGKRR